MNPRMNQQAVKVWVADDLLLNGVAAFRIPVGDLEAQRVGVDQLDRADGVAALVVEEGFPIAHHVLHVAHLRRVDGGVVDLGVDAVGERVPDPARHGVRGSYGIFRTTRPPRLDAGRAGRWILSVQGSYLIGNVSRTPCASAQDSAIVCLIFIFAAAAPAVAVYRRGQVAASLTAGCSSLSHFPCHVIYHSKAYGRQRRVPQRGTSVAEVATAL